MGFPLLLNGPLKWGQGAWISGLCKLDFLEEGHVRSGQVVFPLPLKKALEWGNEAWAWGWSQLKQGMFSVGKWAFPCCSTKQ